MFCQNCGNDMGNMNVCSRCGAVANVGKVAQTWKAGSSSPSGNDGQPQGAPSWRAASSAQGNAAQVQPEQGMKWYKFIIYFQLFFSAVLNVGMAGRYLGGLEYGESAELVYMMYGSLRTLDLFMGIASLALAGLCIYARMQMRRFKKNAVPVYLSISIINVALSVIYALLVSAIVGEGAESAFMTASSQAAGMTVYFMANRDYFKKRKHLFVA